jgi:hypothetical protein
MKTHGKLGDYSWVIDENEWTTLYIGDPNDHNTLFDGLINGDPEEAILGSIVKHYTRAQKSTYNLILKTLP